MRWSWTALAAVFAVVDVVVVGAAFTLSHREAGTADPALAGASPAGSSVSASPSAADPSTGAGSGATPDWTGPLALAASGSGRLVRVTRGSCDERFRAQPRVWVADRFRAPLTEVQVPGLQESLGVTITDRQVTIVGTGPKCAVFGFVSTDGGKTWTKGSVPDDVWYLDTDTTSGVVHGPVKGGEVDTDCVPIAVTTRDEGATAYVSCASLGVLRIARSGKQPTSYSVSGAAAADDGPDGPVALAAASAACTASFLPLAPDRAADATSGSCLGKRDAALGIATSGRRVFAQVGYRLLLSEDAGATFKPYPTS